LSFVPSGEEVFIVGITDNENTAKDLFSQLQGGVIELMQSQPYIDLGGPRQALVVRFLEANSILK